MNFWEKYKKWITLTCISIYTWVFILTWFNLLDAYCKKIKDCTWLHGQNRLIDWETLLAASIAIYVVKKTIAHERASYEERQNKQWISKITSFETLARSARSRASSNLANYKLGKFNHYGMKDSTEFVIAVVKKFDNDTLNYLNLSYPHEMIIKHLAQVTYICEVTEKGHEPKTMIKKLDDGIDLAYPVVISMLDDIINYASNSLESLKLKNY